jgi:micrococcal nuclease
MRSALRHPIAALALALCAAVCGCSATAGEPPSGSGSGRVVRVVDGDTIRVALASGEERVRYIGVDAPESVKPGAPVECFAKRASAFNERLVAGERVKLVRDVEERDRYGRLLAYVYRARDGLFVNAELVRRGYATVATFPPNVAHEREFKVLARRARLSGRGLWSECGGAA